MAYFGVDVIQELTEWIEGDFYSELVKKYGEGNTDFWSAIYPAVSVYRFVLKDLDTPPLLAFGFGNGPSEKMWGDGGLADNVIRKIRFVARTGLPSSEARNRPDLVEPGDFPFAGAGVYRGYFGGVSGFKEEADWWVFCRIVDKLIELRSAVGERAIQASRDRVPGMKYMEGELPGE